MPMLQSANPASRNGLAIVFLAGSWSKLIAGRFERIRNEAAELGACFALIDESRPIVPQWTAFLHDKGWEDSLVRFNIRDIEARLGIAALTKGATVPGSAHFPLLFLAERLHFEHYWLVECDVEFRGHWQTLFSAFQDDHADLLCSHLLERSQRKQWFWWQRDFLTPAKTPPAESDCRKSFLPLYRISARAIDVVTNAHRQGWSGHAECLVPTVLHLHGCVIRDMNSKQQFYAGDRQDPNRDPQRLSTLRWRPPVGAEEFESREQGKALIFHPVKEDWYYDGQRIVTAAEIPDTRAELPTQDAERTRTATISAPPPKTSRKNLLEVDPARDFVHGTAIRKRYCILSSPRSGSTLLSRMLFQTGLAGDPLEYFNPNLLNAERHRSGNSGLKRPEFLQRMETRRTSPNGVFGLKLHHEQALPAFGNQPPHDALLAFLRGHQHLIWVRRRNRLRQAISEALALKTNAWSSEEALAQSEAPLPSLYECVSALNRVCRNDDGWEKLIQANGLSPLVIWYEDFVDDYDHWARRALDHLQIDLRGAPIPEPAIHRQHYAAGESLHRALRDYLGVGA